MKMARLEVWSLFISIFLFNFLFPPNVLASFVSVRAGGTLVASDVWKFGLTSNKPYSLHQGLSLIMVHGDLPVIWPFQSMYTVNCNSEWQLYYFQLVPCSVSALTERKNFSSFLEIYCIIRYI